MDDEEFLDNVDAALGWRLPPEEQAQALAQRRDGKSAAEVADWFQRLEIARTRLNDPSVPLQGPPSRPEDNDAQALPLRPRRG
jgi:hypothetical protein